MRISDWSSDVCSSDLSAIPNPLINEAITVNLLAGITGSASGGMSNALAAMADSFVAAAKAATIPLEVLHRVAPMASGARQSVVYGQRVSVRGYLGGCRKNEKKNKRQSQNKKHT